MLKRIDEQRACWMRPPTPVPTCTAWSECYRHSTVTRTVCAADGSGAALGDNELVAYFCAEFGFHASLPIYSGGLGILAGDHCKAASDNRLPFVAVGLLYRQGYFSQIFDKDGNQQAVYADSDFEDLPIKPVLNVDASELLVQVPLIDHDIIVKVWEARIGHVRLFLLDTDLPINSEHDRSIAHQLYGGDRTTRIEQEIVLGIGGVRALTAVGLKPTVWHINEGHAAFQVLERIRALVAEGLSFEPSLEAVAANTVFTTHTPVPAGHDHFPQEMIDQYFSRYIRELGIGTERLHELGNMGASSDFNMTALAVHGSRFQNGVSRIHGRVSSEILADFWPEVPQQENPLTYVTNGVHVPTFLASQWRDVFDRYLGFGWSQRIHDAETWERIDEIPDHIFWNVRQDLKSQMLHLVRHRVAQQHYRRNHGSESHLHRMLRLTDPDSPRVLTIGFGRRFATYKRATLLFRNLDHVRKLVSDADRPMTVPVRRQGASGRPARTRADQDDPRHFAHA